MKKRIERSGNWEEHYTTRLKLEIQQKWRELGEEVPGIDFSNLLSGAKVSMVPPYSGATARFYVYYKDIRVSVYLDMFEELGCYGEPYWELYPYDDDVFRCAMNETEELVVAINKAIVDRSLLNE